MKTLSFTFTEKDVFLLGEMCKQEGDTAASAFLRKLIREEAARREIIFSPELEEEELQPA